MSTTMPKAGQIDRKWYVIDAAGKPLGRVAAQAALLRGKHKPTFAPHVDCGDHVIIINCKDAVLTGGKAEKKYYYRHTGYIGHLKATVPDGNMGDVMGEINKRRGRVLGMNPGENGMQVVEADVPMAEMGDFATFIRQCTQGRGTFTFEFARYEDAPAQVAQKVIEEAKAAQEGAGE